MEEINLDFQKKNHRDFSVSSDTNASVNDVNIMRPPSDSNIGIDLLINKSKTGSSDSKPEEFKPADPVVFGESKQRQTPSPSLNISSNDDFDLKDIGIDLGDSNSLNNDTSTKNINVSRVDTNTTSFSSKPAENITSIDLNNDDLNLNLDSIFSGFKEKGFAWISNGRKLKSISFDFKKRKRSQELADIVYENGSIFIFNIKKFLQYQNRICGKFDYYEMTKKVSIDIDEKKDLRILKRLI